MRHWPASLKLKDPLRVYGLRAICRSAAGSAILEVDDETLPHSLKGGKSVRVLSYEPEDVFERLTVTNFILYADHAQQSAPLSRV